jgi:alkanesulfonate monooxygenase SsuD/methylene tetrahydromethanopterin reductase-like flavin-dependent oxidoreductase (luciferase family)
MASLTFGLFDHLDRREASLTQIYEDRLQLLETADAAGFYSYHLAEHHVTPLGMAPSPSLFLASAAQRTRRLRLGPLVYLLPLYHPLRLIEEICMLDHLSGGRLDVGVGRGISPYELAYFGVDTLASREIFQESLEVIVSGLQHDQLVHRGEHYRYRGVPMELKPVQQPYPPFWYGAAAPDSAVWAARPAYRDWYDNLAKLWRDFRSVPVNFTDDLELACQHQVAIVGSPDTVRDHVARFADESACNYIVCAFAFGSLTHEQAMRSLELFTSKVMPAFIGGGGPE